MADTAILRLGIDSGGAVRGAAVFERSGRRVTSTATKMDRSLTKTTARIRGLGSAATSVRGSLASLFGGFTGALAIRGVVQTIADFEKSVAVLGVVTQGTTEDLTKMAKQARELGAVTQFTANQVARAMVELARVGFTVTEVTQSISSVLDLAIVGELGLGEAAKIAASQIRTFSLAASETERVVDTLVFITNSAATTIGELGQAMRFAGPTAAAFGFTIEKTAAFLGILADNNLRATLGGTAFRSMVVRLQKPTKEAIEGFEILGLKARDLNPSLRGLEQVFRDLSDAVQEVGREEGLRGFTKIFGRRQLSGALVGIIPQSLEKIDQLTKSLAEQKRIADIAARAIEDTLTGAFIRLKSAAVEVSLALGDAGFKGVIRDIVEVSADVLRMIAGMDDKFIKFGRTTERVLDILKGVVEGFKVWIALKLGIWIGAAILSIEALILSLKALNVAALTNVFTAIPAAIGLAVVAFISFKDETITLMGEVGTLGQLIRATFLTIADIVTDVVGKIVDAIETLLKAIGLLRDEKDNLIPSASGSTGTSLIEDSIRSAGGLGATEFSRNRIAAGLALGTGVLEGIVGTPIERFVLEPIQVWKDIWAKGLKRGEKTSKEIIAGTIDPLESIFGDFFGDMGTVINDTFKENLAKIKLEDALLTPEQEAEQFRVTQQKELRALEERSIKTPITAAIGLIAGPFIKLFADDPEKTLNKLAATELQILKFFKDRKKLAQDEASLRSAAARQIKEIEEEINAVRLEISEVGLSSGEIAARKKEREVLEFLREGPSGDLPIEDIVFKAQAKAAGDIIRDLFTARELEEDRLAILKDMENASKSLIDIQRNLNDEIFVLNKLIADPDAIRSNIEQQLEIERLAVKELTGQYVLLSEAVLEPLELVAAEARIDEINKLIDDLAQAEARLKLSQFDIDKEGRVPRPQSPFGQLTQEFGDIGLSDRQLESKVLFESIDATIAKVNELAVAQGGADDKSKALLDTLMRQKEAVPIILSLVEAFEFVAETISVVGDELGTAISDILLGIKDASDAFRDFALNVLENVVRRAVQKIVDMFTDLLFKLLNIAANAAFNAIMNSGTGSTVAGAAAAAAGVSGSLEAAGGVDINIPSAKGNVFAGGAPTGDLGFKAFAVGDIINRPTKALMGEAGPEAVLPLKRGNDGKLGVTVQGLLSEELATQSLAADRRLLLGDLIDLPDQIRNEFARVRQEIAALRGNAEKPGPSEGIFGLPRFAEGGIVTEPTLAIVGEVPEAIIPLSKVQSSSTETSNGDQRPITVIFNVKSPDVESFRRSRNQIASDMKRAIGGVG